MVLFLEYLTKFLLGYAALTLSFYMASLVVPKAGFVARVLAAYISLLACALYGVLVSIVLTLVGKRQIAQWACGRAFVFAMRYTAGVEFVIDDPDNVLGSTRPAVFIGNHQTELDVLMLGTIFPKYCSVTAKAQLKRVPFLGWFMSLSGTIFVDRKNSQGARSAMDGAANEIRTSRQSVYMFPEGTRSYSKEPMLLPFKKGAFHLAVQSGVPIVPVVVSNYSHILYVKNLVFNSGKIPIKGTLTYIPLQSYNPNGKKNMLTPTTVLAPIPTTNLTAADVDELTRAIRELMLSELTSLTEKARGHPIAVPATNGSSTGKSTAIDK